MVFERLDFLLFVIPTLIACGEIMNCVAAVAVALGNLYHDELEVDVNDVAGVLVVATILDFKSLVDGSVLLN